MKERTAGVRVRHTSRHKKHDKDLHGLLSRPAYLHGHEAIINKNLLGQEVGTDGGLVLVAELFVDILVHQRSLSDTTHKKNNSLCQ